jgi:hypothetical protein
VSAIPGVQVLVDRNVIEPGDSVHGRILEMIDAADCVVVFLTQEGVASREVLDEITRAHDRKKHIIPVVSEGTALEVLPWYIRELNWITYNEKNFDTVVDSITASIKRKVNPLALVDPKTIPAHLNTLLSSGTRFIDVPLLNVLTSQKAVIISF